MSFGNVTLPGGATSGYENLSALLEFVKSPDYLDRVKELRDLEASSHQAHNTAAAIKADAEAKLTELANKQTAHAQTVRDFLSDKAAHDKAVARWQKVMTAVQKALRGED